MNKGFILVVAVLGISALTLSGCKIESDWERSISAQQADEARVEWLKSMKAMDNGNVIAAIETIVIGPNRKVNILLSELDSSGNNIWLKEFDLGDNESIADLLVSNSGAYVLINMPNGSTKILALTAQGEKRWVYAYQDGYARSMKLISDKLYITGKRTQVVSDQGELLVDVHQSDQTWAVETGLLGQFYVAGAKGLSGYDSQGNQLWFVANDEKDLSQQVDLTWQAGALYLAVSSPQSGAAWLKQVNTHLGKVEWSQKVESPAGGLNSLEGPVLMEAAETEHLLLVQSYQHGRQVTMLDNRGHVQWQASQDSGIVRDTAMNRKGDILISGNGITEQYDQQGSRIAWSSVSGQAQSTTGEVEAVGDSIYVGASVYRNGSIQAVVSHYTDK